MKPDRGRALRAEPSTIIDMASVAKQGLGDSIWPANPPMVKIIGICAPITACAMTRMMTLCQARRIDGPDMSVLAVTSTLPKLRRLARARLEARPVPVGHGLTLILGNVFMIVLEGGIVLIQVLRLEFYEGFARYFAGDGHAFKPLRLGPAPERGSAP